MNQTIRAATDQDLIGIEDWLREEWEATGRQYGFYNNVGIIRQSLEAGRLTVISANGHPAGFLSDGSHGPEIFEIHPAHRGTGLGTALAQHMLRSWRRRVSVLEIECSPQQSFGFWSRFGFQRDSPDSGGDYEEDGRTISWARHAYLILYRKRRLGGGPRVPFEIAFYPPERDWKADAQPFGVYAGLAERLEDGSLKLPERAICFRPGGSMSDCVVRIDVDGRLVFEDKVKRDQATALGVKRDTAFYIDRLRLDKGA